MREMGVEKGGEEPACAGGCVAFEILVEVV